MKGHTRIKKLMLIFIAVAMLFCFNISFADSYQEGLKLYEQSKYSEAIEKFKISLKDGSADKEDIHLYLGIAYYAVNENEKAFNELNIAKTSSNKENREAAYSNLASFYFLEGNLIDAEANCKDAIKENPNSPVHNWLMGQIYLGMNETEKAKEYFNKSIEVSDKSYLAYDSLGNIYVTEKDYKKAYEYFKKAIEIREDYIAGYKNIIDLIPKEIIPEKEYKIILTKYINLNPSDAEAKQRLEKLDKNIKSF